MATKTKTAPTVNEMVETYIALRDARDAKRAAQKAEMAPYEKALSDIEAKLLDQFSKLGVESMRTDAGTAFKSTRTSATVADWDVLLRFIVRQDMWNMLERRVSKEAVTQFREAHDDLPPGVNWREEVTINVRRS